MADLYVLVEGNDDERLVHCILQRCFKTAHPVVMQYAKGAHLDPKFVNMVVQLIAGKGHAYLLLTDLDDYGSVERRAEQRAAEFGIDREHVVVADKTIESWYLAGATMEPITSKLGSRSPEGMGKADFHKIIGRPFKHIRVMNSIIGGYDVKKARRSSKSFAYFYHRLESVLGSPTK